MADSFETLDEVECRELLAKSSIGRIGAFVDGQVVVLPVTFVLDGSSIMFRTDTEGAIARAVSTEVAFEVDHFDELSQTGWSVLVQGRAHDITHALDELAERLRTLSVSPWAPGERTVWVSIGINSITGRRIS